MYPGVDACQAMPYEISFTMKVVPSDPDEYFSDCCVGGDVVVNRLLPSVEARYRVDDSNQEDWGWFIWFEKGGVRFAIDVFTDDHQTGSFRIHLTSRVRTWLRSKTVDTPELEELRALVVSELQAWGAAEVTVTRIDRM